jgi:hypothetical protein
MNTRILNREGQLPADHWYQIEVPGQHYNAAAGLVQVIDDRAVAQIVNRFSEEARAEHFAGVRIGRDHLAESLEQPTEALGWLMELRNRDGIPEGRIEWTALGRPLVEGKVYKFFSTEYLAAETEPAGTVTVRNREVRAVRPLRLAGLEVTNKPNNKGGKPISNRDAGDVPAAGKPENQPTMNKLKELLGLPAEATEDQIYTAVQALKGKATEAEPIKNRLATLEGELKTLREAQIEADLDAHKAVITNREAVKAVLVANREAGLAMLKGLKLGAPAAQPERITNRATAAHPADRVAEGEKADKADAEVRAYKIANRCSYEDAHSAVRRLKPELFA